MGKIVEISYRLEIEDYQAWLAIAHVSSTGKYKGAE